MRHIRFIINRFIADDLATPKPRIQGTEPSFSDFVALWASPKVRCL
jgi:hypothetical protein